MVLAILELFLQTQAGLELIEIHKPLLDLKAYSTTARQSRTYYGGKCVVCWWNLEAVIESDHIIIYAQEAERVNQKWSHAMSPQVQYFPQQGPDPKGFTTHATSITTLLGKTPNT